MRPGANCADGSKLTSLISGSVWNISAGIWTLIGCPPGYYLTFDRCQLCHATFFCVGGNIGSTPCGPGLFAYPGANASAACKISVFVTIKISVPILRPEFSDFTTTFFQTALAYAINVDLGSVFVDIIQFGANATTLVTAQVSTLDAFIAAALIREINLRSVSSQGL